MMVEADLVQVEKLQNWELKNSSEVRQRGC